MWPLFLAFGIIGIILAVLGFIIATEGRYFGKRLIRWGYNRRSVTFEVRDDWELWEHLIQRLRIEPSERLLDLGTQTGHFPRLVARQRGFRGEIVGIDWSEEMIQEAQRQARLEGSQNRIRFLCRDVQQPLPFQKNTFTLVTVVTGLLNGVKSSETLFEEIQRVLRPYGRVAFRFTPQALGYSPIRKAEWLVTRLAPFGFQYIETLSWTPTHEILIFRLSEPGEIDT